MIGTATNTKDGLMPSYRSFHKISFNQVSEEKIAKIFSIAQYGYVAFYIYNTSVGTPSPSTGFVFINNRCSEGNENVIYKQITFSSNIKLYYKKNGDNSIDVYSVVSNSYTDISVCVIFIVSIVMLDLKEDTSISKFELTLLE